MVWERCRGHAVPAGSHLIQLLKHEFYRRIVVQHLPPQVTHPLVLLGVQGNFAGLGDVTGWFCRAVCRRICTVAIVGSLERRFLLSLRQT